jgi:hypothetical protein
LETTPPRAQGAKRLGLLSEEPPKNIDADTRFCSDGGARMISGDLGRRHRSSWAAGIRAEGYIMGRGPRAWEGLRAAACLRSKLSIDDHRFAKVTDVVLC